MPSKSLASATKLINQHLFGLQNNVPKMKGKTEKLSLSQDSIDSMPSIGSHKRSKSILKNKSESSKGQTDPESERLLADNLSGAGISETGSGEASSDYSPNKLPHPLAKSVSPPLSQRHRILLHQRSTPAPSTSKLAKHRVPRCPEEASIRQTSTRHLLTRGYSTNVDHFTGDTRVNSDNERNETKESETAFVTHALATNVINTDQNYCNTGDRKVLIKRYKSADDGDST